VTIFSNGGIILYAMVSEEGSRFRFHWSKHNARGQKHFMRVISAFFSRRDEKILWTVHLVDSQSSNSEKIREKSTRLIAVNDGLRTATAIRRQTVAGGAWPWETDIKSICRLSGW